MTPISTLRLSGVHHVSALTAQIQRTHDFYTRVLGLRPVIKTVNQDDPSMYHLFFGDGAGSPGSDMTMFDMPFAASASSAGTTASRSRTFRVDGEAALAYWAARLDELRHRARRHRARATGAWCSTSTIPRARSSRWSMTAVRVRRSRGTRARCRPSTRSAGSATRIITVPELEPHRPLPHRGAGAAPRSRLSAARDGREHQVHVYLIGDGGETSVRRRRCT